MKNTVLITGAYSGIGYATARLFYKKNWDIIGIDIIRNSDKIFKDFYLCDLSSKDEVYEVSEDIKSKYNIINSIVFNAGIQNNDSFLDFDYDNLLETFQVNVFSIFLLSKYLKELIIKGEASIVNISSIHSKVTSKNISSYAVSKGAISTLTRVMAIELAEYNIRVNAVLPGAVDTNMLNRSLKRFSNNIDDIKNKIINNQLIKKLAKPEDISNLIFFLCSKEASFITGQEFIIDSGVTIELTSEK